MTPSNRGMPAATRPAWDIDDDFDDFDLTPAEPAVPHRPVPDEFDDDFGHINLAPTPPNAVAPVQHTRPLQASRMAAVATATAAGCDLDDGVVFGNDPDFDVLGSATYGAVFDIPGRDDVLRTTQRTDNGRHRSRGRTTQRDNNDFDLSMIDTEPAPDRRSTRDERVASARAAREQKAQERKQARETRSAEKAEQRQTKAAERAINKLGSSEGKTKRVLAVCAACLTVAVAASGIAFAVTGGDNTGPEQSSAVSAASAGTPTDPTAGTPTAGATIAADECPTATVGKVITGRDAGTPTSGPGAIKAFNYAYYVDRDATKVAAVVHPDSVKAVIGSPADLQRTLDALPPGTTHCLTITDRGDGLYATELSQIPPGGGDPTVYRQLIQTVKDGDKTVIVSNTATY